MDINKFINTIIEGDTIKNLKRLPDESIDFIFADPPYGQGLEMRVLQSVGMGHILAKRGLLIIEQAAKVVPTQRIGPLVLLRERCYGAARICFYEWQEVQDG